MHPDLAALTDDLTPSQFQSLLDWLWRAQQFPTPRAVRRWRQLVNLAA
jgi:hypothetical protein